MCGINLCSKLSKLLDKYILSGNERKVFVDLGTNPIFLILEILDVNVA
jgi:hypothetical protein